MLGAFIWNHPYISSNKILLHPPTPQNKIYNSYLYLYTKIWYSNKYLTPYQVLNLVQIIKYWLRRLRRNDPVGWYSNLFCWSWFFLNLSVKQTKGLYNSTWSFNFSGHQSWVGRTIIIKRVWANYKIPDLWDMKQNMIVFDAVLCLYSAVECSCVQCVKFSAIFNVECTGVQYSVVPAIQYSEVQ